MGKKKQSTFTVRQMTDEELAIAHEKIGRRNEELRRQRKRKTKGTPISEAKRAILAGETFASQKPSTYRRRIKRK